MPPFTPHSRTRSLGLIALCLCTRARVRPVQYKQFGERLARPGHASDTAAHTVRSYRYGYFHTKSNNKLDLGRNGQVT